MGRDLIKGVSCVVSSRDKEKRREEEKRGEERRGEERRGETKG